jgi:hypothetical protein
MNEKDFFSGSWVGLASWHKKNLLWRHQPSAIT